MPAAARGLSGRRVEESVDFRGSAHGVEVGQSHPALMRPIFLEAAEGCHHEIPCLVAVTAPGGAADAPG